MAMSLKELKKNRNNLASLVEEIDKLSGGFQKPEEQLNFWKPTADKGHNGSAIIRFLAPPKGETQAFVRSYTHGFKGPTDKWLIDNCPTTLGPGTPCPICEMNNKLWGEGEGSDGRVFVSGNPNVKPPRPGSKRKKTYISNILVIKDALHPENEGKVFKYSYGQKIFDKIVTAIKGDEGTDTAPIEVFDMWGGANFKLKFANSSGQRSYDASAFDTPSPVAETDKEIEEIWEKEYSLQACVAPSTFKTYEELQKRLNIVMGVKGPQAKTIGDAVEGEPSIDSEDEPNMESVGDTDDEDFTRYLESLQG